MSAPTLATIITKIRKLAAVPNSNQYTDSVILDYVNSFYLYDFPAEFRSLSLKDTYTFNTIKGIDTYPFDMDHWINVQEPCWIAKRKVRLFQDPTQFYYFNFNSTTHWEQIETLQVADGTANFSGTLQNVPILRSINNNPIVDTQTSNTSKFPAGYPPTFTGSNISRIQNVLITTNLANGSTLNVTDDGAGNLLGDVVAGGTIDYATGAISGSFSQNTVSGENIKVLYNPVVLNIPLAILFYQNQIILRPVPDMGYTVEICGYRSPSQALLTSTTDTNFSGRTEQLEWWECVAVGAAKKIYEDRLDMDGVAMMDKMLQERYQVCYTRTYSQMGKKRIATIFADQLEFNSGTGPFGIGNYN